MKKLAVMLIHRDNDNYRNLCGWWSYPVHQFEWSRYRVPPFNFHAQPDLNGYDLIVLEDWIFGEVYKQGKKMAYAVVDSARSPDQLSRNITQAKQADLILVDSDRLEKFAPAGKPVKRFAYAVNEQLYHPREKKFDVAFLCWPTPERRVIQQKLGEICKRRGWSYLTSTYANYQDYAEAIGLAKIVVHKQHVENARSWRVFDVMASKCCLLTSPIPTVSGDGIHKWVDYHEYKDVGDLEDKLEFLMTGPWEEIANNGYATVMEKHTWKTRAEELRQILSEVLGL